MKLAIKGHPERGKEVLQLLEMFGGKAKKKLGWEQIKILLILSIQREK